MRPGTTTRHHHGIAFVAKVLARQFSSELTPRPHTRVALGRFRRDCALAGVGRLHAMASASA